MDAAAKLDSLNVSSINSRLNHIGSKLKILQQIQNDKSNINAERTSFFIMAYHYFSRRTTMIFTRHLLTVMTMKIFPTLKCILTVITESSATAAIPYSLHLDATTTAIILEDARDHFLQNVGHGSIRFSWTSDPDQLDMAVNKR
ncbi:hypothetical protein F2P79_012759 [Pimephales promelas]|nr:hypothetical protein F2P79_012759 [Pimephales promelas]